MSQEFSSKIIMGGNAILPQTIIVTDNAVTLKQRNKWLIGTDMVTIQKKQIASIEINTHLVGATISIYTVGNSKIVANNFSNEDAYKIKELLEN